MNDGWTEDELRAAVEAYVQMHSDETNGIPFVKNQIYSNLSEQFGRTKKSFAYRMHNISYVYSLMGRNWVSGLKPAKNVGSNIAAIIERLISEVEGQLLLPVAEFESQVLSYKSKKTFSKPAGIKNPETTVSKVTSHIRDPEVKAWVLKEAGGNCECCNSKAPFISENGEPFLEVHHLRQLADGGSDTISNVIALCPNCHREMHYGLNRVALVKSMYTKISRLVHE